MELGNVVGGKLRLDDPTFLEKFATAATSITLPASIGCAPMQNGMMGNMMPLVMQNMQAMQRLQAMHIMQVMQKLKDIEEMEAEGRSGKKTKKVKKKSSSNQPVAEGPSSQPDQLQNMQLMQEQLMRMQSAQTMQCVQNMQATTATQAALPMPLPTAPVLQSQMAVLAAPPALNSMEAVETISAEELEKMWEPLPLAASSGPALGSSVPSSPVLPLGNAPFASFATIPASSAVDSAMDQNVGLWPSQTMTALPCSSHSRSETFPTTTLSAEFGTCPTLGTSLATSAAVVPSVTSVPPISVVSNSDEVSTSSGAVAALVAQATAAAVSNMKTAKEAAVAAASTPTTQLTVLPEQSLPALTTQERYVPSPIRKAIRSRSRKASHRSHSRKNKSGSSSSSSKSKSRSRSRSKSARKRGKKRKNSRDPAGFAKPSKFEDPTPIPRLPLPQLPPAATAGPVPDWMSDLVRQRPPVTKNGFKALTVMATHVGHLIGPNGSTIMAIRKASGSDIKIDHGRGKAYGTVTITGNVDLAERLIFEVVASRDIAQSSVPYAVS